MRESRSQGLGLFMGGLSPSDPETVSDETVSAQPVDAEMGVWGLVVRVVRLHVLAAAPRAGLREKNPGRDRSPPAPESSGCVFARWASEFSL